MSKYVIELREDCEIVQQICSNGKGVRVGSVAVECLEELTADYINEHYGELQDTAYKKGIEDGKAVNDKGCEGCKYTNKVLTCPCSECSNNYKNHWTAKSDKIEVGDEVKSLNDLGVEIKGFLPWVVTIIDEDDDYCQGIDKEGRVHATKKVRACKTGRHFGIDKILKQMKVEEDDFSDF